MEKVDIFEFFPLRIKNELIKYLNEYKYNLLEEIRIRINRPILLKFNNKLEELEYIIKTEDILEIMQKITENSIYSYQKQISEGYITLKGGHRVRNIRKCCNRRKKSNKYKLYI